MEKYYMNCLSRDLYNYETYITPESLKKYQEKLDNAKIIYKR